MAPAGSAADDDVTARRQAAADEREHEADDRETALELRESRLDAALEHDEGRRSIARAILEEAGQRDDVSDARDATADDRELAASRAEFLDQVPAHGTNLTELRRAAALDRLHSKSDRASAASDRAELAGEDAATHE